MMKRSTFQTCKLSTCHRFYTEPTSSTNFSQIGNKTFKSLSATFFVIHATLIELNLDKSAFGNSKLYTVEMGSLDF
ncbi:expressed unknown protein [Seminavis robusta]|uniref:Uncharacterized protein n=1 Tax=Seminavis robusta TaxID=568900 RepID=A0A9N8EL73_9STRA|nr:expressed unknown protein [Seminavis robusta]|eukprot:Sro1148_g246470.1 n/a (76) ;mRNA; r:8551-8944